MQQQKEKPATQNRFLAKRVVTGSGIALVLISIFLFTVDHPDPSWSKFWYIRPLVIVTLGGAMGGLFFHLMDRFRVKGGWKKLLITIICLIVYIFGLWISTVLGLDGTLWN